jgi:23S rRNA (cytidine1920-2'-O)/16S rRNA (cytidine1409-2'-O)-methyltransferase
VNPPADKPFVSRGGLKLVHAITRFGLDIRGLTCADLGCSTGGFVDVLLRNGAERVYAVDTGYGVLDWGLRNDPRVIVHERTNAMHVTLPEPVNLVTIDAGWTPQGKLLPNVGGMLGDAGQVVTLVKPHYEVSDATMLRRTKGVLPADRLPGVLERVRRDVREAGFEVVGECESPVTGSRGKNARGNVEFLFHLRPAR